MQVEDIKVFIPSQDFALSKAFYLAMGFSIIFETAQVCEFENGDCSFLLQNFYHEGLANNLMVQLVVSSVEDVYKTLQSLTEFGIKFSEPGIVPWGNVLHLWGPAGELWHITQFSESS